MCPGNLLTNFVLSRVEDSEGLGSCAKGLLALEERGKWDNETVTKIMESCVWLYTSNRWLVLSATQAPREHLPLAAVQAAERTIPHLTTCRHLDGKI